MLGFCVERTEVHGWTGNMFESTGDIFYSDGAKELSLNLGFYILLQKNSEEYVKTEKLERQQTKSSPGRRTWGCCG